MATRHILTIDDLSDDEIREVFRIADEMAPVCESRSSIDLLNGKVMATLFYEPSTRTRLSFETAMYRLGGNVVSGADMRASSSAAKGETIADTARVVSQYADVIVIRHPLDGSARVAARHSDVHVINAGDGTHEHPTQTLCDLYTLLKEKGRIEGLTVALCGDLKYGRTIHSLASALARFRARLVLLPAKGLDLPEDLERKLSIRHGQRLERTRSLSGVSDHFENFDAVYMTPADQGSFPFSDQVHILVDLSKKIHKLDVVYMTRLQRERQSAGAPDHYLKMDADLLKSPKLKDAIVMHPLPRVDEISRELDHDPRSKYFAQVKYGVVIRMALLRFLLSPPQPAIPGVETDWTTGLQVYRPEAGSRLDCANSNCVTRSDEGVAAEFLILTKEKSYSSHDLILECLYCGYQQAVGIVGNRRVKKFCRYDPALEKLVDDWWRVGVLRLFRTEGDAINAGLSAYVTGSKTQIMSADDIAAAIERMAKDIAREIPRLEDVCLIGIVHRGDVLARRIQAILKRDYSVEVPVGALDVLPYRDDVRTVKIPRQTPDLSIEGKIAVLVDDVFYSGRTARAAMNALMSGAHWGRPKGVWVAVLIDRGHREVPIEARFVGKRIPTQTIERVDVRLRDLPGGDSGRDEVAKFVVLVDGEPAKGR
jgi:aspartate carbamoyltransferase catalytic subunit